MKLSLLITCVLVAISSTLAQIPVDSTIRPANMWPDPTQPQLESWFFNYWYTSVLQPDSIRLRPGNSFAIPFDGRNFTMRLDSVIGTANLRQSKLHWTYVGQIRDSVTNEFLRDTTVTDTLSLPFTNWGEVNRCGVVENPSNSTYIGKIVTYTLPWINEQLIILPTMIFSSGSNTQVLLRLIHSEMGGFPISPSSGYLIPNVSIETQ